MNRPCPSLLTSLVLSLGLALVLALALAFALAMAFADVPALASPQSQQAQPTQQTPPEKEKPDAKKPKKVWTNDDMQGLGGTSGVSVVGEAPAAPGRDNAPAQPRGYVKEKDPTSYRQQLAPLRAELERLDKETTRTREFINGEHTGEGRLKVNVFSVPMNPSDQIAQLEKRKLTVQNKIAALEDLARRNDIPPGALR